MFRSEDGAHVFCRFAATFLLPQEGQRVLDVLQSALTGAPYFPPFLQARINLPA